MRLIHRALLPMIALGSLSWVAPAAGQNYTEWMQMMAVAAVPHQTPPPDPDHPPSTQQACINNAQSLWRDCRNRRPRVDCDHELATDTYLCQCFEFDAPIECTDSCARELYLCNDRSLQRYDHCIDRLATAEHSNHEVMLCEEGLLDSQRDCDTSNRLCRGLPVELEEPPTDWGPQPPLPQTPEPEPLPSPSLMPDPPPLRDSLPHPSPTRPPAPIEIATPMPTSTWVPDAQPSATPWPMPTW